MPDETTTRPWWAKGVKHFDLTDDEAELAFEATIFHGAWYVTGNSPARLRIVHMWPSAEGWRDDDATHDAAAFFRCVRKGIFERVEGRGRFAGRYTYTRAAERWSYYCYRDGGAVPWDGYRHGTPGRPLPE